MKRIYPDLWQSKSGSHFGLNLRTYLLETKEGNVVIYYTHDLDEMEHIQSLGKVQNQYISHHHEINTSLVKNLITFGTRLICHKEAVPYLYGEILPEITINSDQVIDDVIEVYDTPGHTNSNLCIRYQSPHGKSYLFTGDTIYLDRGKWNILVLPREGGSYSDLKKSLLKLRNLQVDVVITSLGVKGNDVVEVTEEGWHTIIDEILAKL